MLKGLKKKTKNRITPGKTYNKAPRRINQRATKSEPNTGTTALERSVNYKKSNRKAQGVQELQAATLSKHQDEEKTDKINKRKSSKRTKSTKISSLFSKRGNRNVKRTEKKYKEQNNTRQNL